MALYVKFECATCENENCYGHSLHTTEKVCDGYKHTATNADRIRSMSDEDLAETYAGGCPNGDRLNCGKYYWRGGRDCFNCWLDWLKAPVEVDNG